MQVTGIGWAGTRTDAYEDMVAFCTGVLGLTREHEERDFAVLGLPSGDTFEVFGPSDTGHRYSTAIFISPSPCSDLQLCRAG